MKKFFLVLFLLSLFAFPLSSNVSAYEDSYTESVAEEAGAMDISSDCLEKEEISGDRTINIFEKAFMLLYEALNDNKSTVLKSFAGILAVIILSSVINALKNITKSQPLKTSCEYVSIISLSCACYSVFSKLFVFIQAGLEAMNAALASLLPVIASLYAFGGNPSAAAASNSGMLLFMTVITTVCTKFIFPFLKIAFSLCLVSAMPGSVNLAPVSSAVRNTCTVTLAFLFSVLSFTLFLQTSIAASADTYVTRSVRFASGVFVPVIGNMLGDAARTVVSSVSCIKSTVGAVGTVLLMSALIPPITITVLHKLLLLLCSVISRMLGCEREGRFLSELNGLTGVIMALLIGSCSVCVIALALFIKTGV